MGIPTITYRAPLLLLVALFLCYERYSTRSLSDVNPAEVIDALISNSRYPEHCYVAIIYILNK